MNIYRALIPECLEGRILFLADAFKENLARLEVASQKGLVERFDASIGAGTVHMPFAGKYQLTPEEAMVAKIPLESGETDDATAMSYGYIPGICKVQSVPWCGLCCGRKLVPLSWQQWALIL